jgi:hypothetical protein
MPVTIGLRRRHTRFKTYRTPGAAQRWTLIHTEIYNLAESYSPRFRIIALLTDGLAVTSQVSCPLRRRLVMDWQSSNSESALVGRGRKTWYRHHRGVWLSLLRLDGTRNVPNTVRRYEIHSYTYKFSIRVQRTYVYDRTCCIGPRHTVQNITKSPNTPHSCEAGPWMLSTRLKVGRTNRHSYSLSMTRLSHQIVLQVGVHWRTLVFGASYPSMGWSTT